MCRSLWGGGGVGGRIAQSYSIRRNHTISDMRSRTCVDPEITRVRVREGNGLQYLYYNFQPATWHRCCRSLSYCNLPCSCRYYTMHNGMIYTKYTLHFSSSQSTTEIWRVWLSLDTTSAKEIINNNEKWLTTPITGGKQMLRLFLSKINCNDSYTYVHAIHRREWRHWSGHSNIEGEGGYQQSGILFLSDLWSVTKKKSPTSGHSFAG